MKATNNKAPNCLEGWPFAQSGKPAFKALS